MNAEEKKRYMMDKRKGYRLYWSKKRKGEYIGEIVEATGYDRKVVIRMLKQTESPPCKLGAPKKLHDSDVGLLLQIWKLAGYICAQYLHKALSGWLDDIVRLPNGSVPDAQRKRLLAVSYKTMERELKNHRVETPVKNESFGVKAAVKAGIELVPSIRIVCEPGHICIDTVAHCGTTLQGDFVWTLTWTDIYTGFTLNVAIWNKGYAGIEEAMLYCIEHTPFPIIDINTDNGSEFLNHNLFAFWEKHLPMVKITRSRPSHKNDNAHAEQKNRTHVREMFGRYRLEKPEYVGLMNGIYRRMRYFRNYITPCKIVIERRWNAVSHRYVRIYEKEPLTPVERILRWAEETNGISEEVQEQLRGSLKKINRLTEAAKLDKLVEDFYQKLSQDPAANK